MTSYAVLCQFILEKATKMPLDRQHAIFAALADLTCDEDDAKLLARIARQLKGAEENLARIHTNAGLAEILLEGFDKVSLGDLLGKVLQGRMIFKDSAYLLKELSSLENKLVGVMQSQLEARATLKKRWEK
jgi:hypothetical protein